MNSVAVAANLATAPSDMEYFCLQKICEFCDWQVGQVFTCVDSTTGQIQSGKNFYFGDDIRFEAFLEASLEKTFQQGEDLIGRVFDEGNPLWVTDVTVDPAFTRSEAARSSGLKGAAIVPVKIENEVVAVLEFLSDREIQSGLDELEILSFVTQQMSRTEERARTARELTNHRDHLQHMVNSATRELEDRAVRLTEALAKEKEMNELQRQFVAMASHEFRTPLAIIDSTAQRIKSRRDKNKLTPEDLDERLQNIRVAVQRMTKLMESILSTARMEAGMAKLVAAPCDIGKVIQEICEHQQEISPHHNITWSLVGFPETIDAFAGTLEQIFTNLLSNAVKYAPDAPDIDVYGWVENDQVVISIQDHGLGIDQEDIKKIGERFFRAKTATSIGGTGIGLNLVKALIEEHGGALSVESVKGEGSIFTVQLPIHGPVEDHSHTRQLAEASA
jgi:signal transduction histidine kinase